MIMLTKDITKINIYFNFSSKYCFSKTGISLPESSFVFMRSFTFSINLLFSFIQTAVLLYKHLFFYSLLAINVFVYMAKNLVSLASRNV